MLVLSRKVGERVIIQGGIRVSVLSVRGTTIRLGFEAPGDVTILREELAFEVEDQPTQGTRTVNPAP